MAEQDQYVVPDLVLWDQGHNHYRDRKKAFCWREVEGSETVERDEDRQKSQYQVMVPDDGAQEDAETDKNRQCPGLVIR